MDTQVSTNGLADGVRFPSVLFMRATTHTHRFTPEEIEEMKNQTGMTDEEKVIEEWARRNYPIGKGVYTIEAIETNDKGGEVSIQER